MRTGELLPQTTFYFREHNPNFTGVDKTDWVEKTTFDIFQNRKLVVFSVPGPFTPVCSGFQLPQYEKYYNDFRFEYGYDDVYCHSVMDYFVMKAWFKEHNIKNVKMLPDGNGNFARLLGMLVDRSEIGYGMRSWRHALLTEPDMTIKRMFAESNPEDKLGNDPYGESSPQNLIEYLRREKAGEDLKEELLYPKMLRHDRQLGEKGEGPYKEFSKKDAFKSVQSTIDK